MKQKNKIYLALGIVISAFFSFVSVMNHYGIRLQSWIANVLGSFIFSAPIVILLFEISGDNRINLNIRFVAKVVAWFICACCLGGNHPVVAQGTVLCVGMSHE